MCWMMRIRDAEAFLAHLMLCLFDVLVHPSYCAIYLSLRSMWSLKPQSKIVVIRRGFLKPVSIATHLSSWALLPSYPLCHTASLSSSPCPITVSELRRYGHGVDPLWLLLSLQSLREIKPAWVCFLSVVSLSIWLSTSLLYLSNRHSHDRNLFLPDHMLYPTPWLLECLQWTFCSFVCLPFEWATCWLWNNEARNCRERTSERLRQTELVD